MVVFARRYRVAAVLPVYGHSRFLADAAQSIFAQKFDEGCALVVVNEAGRMTGIFTDGDLRRLIMKEGEAGLDALMSAVMTKEPRHLTSDQLVGDTVQLVREHRQDEIPVVDGDGKPVGMVDVQGLISMKEIEE